jgi:hypothetical protein
VFRRHFTYTDDNDTTTLKQGDILAKTQELVDLLNICHSYYASTPEYSHFQVITQTCDLVRRGKNNECASRYITLAAVRSLDTVISRAINDFADKKLELEGVLYCSEKHKDKLKSVLASIFNNNDKNVFFLKASPTDGLLDDSCTFLHLSIAIRAYEHYDLCLRAKVLELRENFRSKLGWMVGNLYSRVGTEDYVPGALPDQASFNAAIEKTLERHIAWIPAEAFAAFKESATPGLDYHTVIENAHRKITDKNEQRLNSFLRLLERHGQLSSDQVRKLGEFLRSTQGERFLK